MTSPIFESPPGSAEDKSPPARFVINTPERSPVLQNGGNNSRVGKSEFQTARGTHGTRGKPPTSNEASNNRPRGIATARSSLSTGNSRVCRRVSIRSSDVSSPHENKRGTPHPVRLGGGKHAGASPHPRKLGGHQRSPVSARSESASQSQSVESKRLHQSGLGTLLLRQGGDSLGALGVGDVSMGVETTDHIFVGADLSMLNQSVMNHSVTQERPPPVATNAGAQNQEDQQFSSNASMGNQQQSPQLLQRPKVDLEDHHDQDHQKDLPPAPRGGRVGAMIQRINSQEKLRRENSLERSASLDRGVVNSKSTSSTSKSSSPAGPGAPAASADRVVSSARGSPELRLPTESPVEIRGVGPNHGSPLDSEQQEQQEASGRKESIEELELKEMLAREKKQTIPLAERVRAAWTRSQQNRGGGAHDVLREDAVAEGGGGEQRFNPNEDVDVDAIQQDAQKLLAHHKKEANDGTNGAFSPEVDSFRMEVEEAGSPELPPETYSSPLETEAPPLIDGPATRFYDVRSAGPKDFLVSKKMNNSGGSKTLMGLGVGDDKDHENLSSTGGTTSLLSGAMRGSGLGRGATSSAASKTHTAAPSSSTQLPKPGRQYKRRDTTSTTNSARILGGQESSTSASSSFMSGGNKCNYKTASSSTTTFKKYTPRGTTASASTSSTATSSLPRSTTPHQLQNVEHPPKMRRTTRPVSPGKAEDRRSSAPAGSGIGGQLQGAKRIVQDLINRVQGGGKTSTNGEEDETAKAGTAHNSTSTSSPNTLAKHRFLNSSGSSAAQLKLNASVISGTGVGAGGSSSSTSRQGQKRENSAGSGPTSHRSGRGSRAPSSGENSTRFRARPPPASTYHFVAPPRPTSQTRDHEPLKPDKAPSLATDVRGEAQAHRVEELKKAQQQKEQAEIALAHSFRAREIQDYTDLGVARHVERRGCTEPRPFRLSSSRNSTPRRQSPGEQEEGKNFRARPIPETTFQPAELPPRATFESTKPVPPRLSSGNRQRPPSPSKNYRTESPPQFLARAMPDFDKVKFQPKKSDHELTECFDPNLSTEFRGMKHREVFEERRRSLMEERERKEQFVPFVARPIADYSDQGIRAVEKRPATTCEPFHLSEPVGRAREGSASGEGGEGSAVFRAQPPPQTTYEPEQLPERKPPTITEAAPFKLSSNEETHTLKRFLRKKEEDKRAEQEKVEPYKARPAPDFSKVPKASPKPAERPSIVEKIEEFRLSTSNFSKRPKPEEFSTCPKATPVKYEEYAEKFKAKPVERREVTEPCPFRGLEERQRERSLTPRRRAYKEEPVPQFKARPVPQGIFKPPRPPSSGRGDGSGGINEAGDNAGGNQVPNRRATLPMDIRLHSDKQALKREAFEREKAQRMKEEAERKQQLEAQKQKEEQERLAAERKRLEFKAKPVPEYRSGLPQVTKPALTEPKESRLTQPLPHRAGASNLHNKNGGTTTNPYIAGFNKSSSSSGAASGAIGTTNVVQHNNNSQSKHLNTSTGTAGSGGVVTSFLGGDIRTGEGLPHYMAPRKSFLDRQHSDATPKGSSRQEHGPQTSNSTNANGANSLSLGTSGPQRRTTMFSERQTSVGQSSGAKWSARRTETSTGGILTGKTGSSKSTSSRDRNPLLASSSSASSIQHSGAVGGSSNLNAGGPLSSNAVGVAGGGAAPATSSSTEQAGFPQQEDSGFTTTNNGGGGGGFRRSLIGSAGRAVSGKNNKKREVQVVDGTAFETPRGGVNSNEAEGKLATVFTPPDRSGGGVLFGGGGSDHDQDKENKNIFLSNLEEVQKQYQGSSSSRLPSAGLDQENNYIRKRYHDQFEQRAGLGGGANRNFNTEQHGEADHSMSENQQTLIQRPAEDPTYNLVSSNRPPPGGLGDTEQFSMELSG
ncbi:unnamed protein product [Amoebophrya sp. A25]|nr:unnamed protein product [Amoebophrya sp. A25]|eukprot:GSA25T00004952001.1